MRNESAAVTRRRFLKSAAGAGAVLTLPYFVPGTVLGKGDAVPAGERIVMGGVGIGGRGQYILSLLLNEPAVQFVAVADVRAERRQAVKQLVDEKYGNQDCATYSDMFEVFARPDIDAVLIATGDRWHALASILAAKAGKDIYCEKPCSMTIAESLALADTVRRYGRIYQAGTQRRTIPNFILAAEFAHSGKLGRLQTLHANTLDPAVRHDWLPAEPQPAEDQVDWDRWLGPCPWRPYHPNYVRGHWRGHFDFHGGGILEWGSHTVDLCQWAAQADHTAPVEYEPQGKHVHAAYENGVKLVMRDTDWLGLGTCSVRYEGDQGWVETGDSGKMVVSPSLQHLHQDFTMAGTASDNHVREFIECIKSRKSASSNADVAGQSHIASHAAYIAWQLGRKLRYDPVKNEFVGDEEANRMRSRAYREPWRI